MILQLWADVKYHVPTGFGFSPKASGIYPFGDATALAGEGGVSAVVWLIQASASNHKPKGRFFWFVVYVVCLKSDIPQHKRQVRSTGIAKRLFFMFLFQFPSIYPLNLCFNRNRQIFNILRQKPQEGAF